ncbi:hypothetical protein [Streptomyces sp. Ru72]|uniref:hypothetical protein n=1 Tax=Streptomyces sp. Ru72 TaxID=2080747 RepID=UPI0015E3FD6E|nr:hypothetical protein [Streptomyces sp. Ru72]
MAKNKNRKQAGPQNRSPKAEQAQEQRPAAEAHTSPMAQAPGSPADATRKKQKSFGHN